MLTLTDFGSQKKATAHIEAVTQRNSNATLIVAFLYRLAEVWVCVDVCLLSSCSTYTHMDEMLSYRFSEITSMSSRRKA